MELHGLSEKKHEELRSIPIARQYEEDLDEIKSLPNLAVAMAKDRD